MRRTAFGDLGVGETPVRFLSPALVNDNREKGVEFRDFCKEKTLIPVLHRKYVFCKIKDITELMSLFLTLL